MIAAVLLVTAGLLARQAVTLWSGKASARDPIVDGYAVRLDAAGAVLGVGASVRPGDRIGFALNARREQTIIPVITGPSGKVVATLPAAKIAPHAGTTSAPWIDGSNYPVAFAWTVPAATPGGVYYLDGLPDIFFAVKTTASPPPAIAVLLPTHTLNAYSATLGRSLYRQPVMVQAVSFLRPQHIEKAAEWRGFLRWVQETQPFGSERPAYVTDADMEDDGLLPGAKVLIVLGHSEYWTRRARINFDAFIARGGNAVIAGGDVMWWQTRLSADGQVMYEYRLDKPAAEGGDPVADPKLRTVYWNNPKLGLPALASIGGAFTYGGYGQRDPGGGPAKSTMTVAAAGSPLLAGTGLKNCGLLDVPMSTEWDGAPITGLDAAGRPVADIARIGAARFEIIAYKWNRNGPHLMLGTMHMMQRAPGSGYVLHMGGRSCCMGEEFYAGAGHGKTQVQTILRNAVGIFLASGDPFTPNAAPGTVAFPMSTPWLKPMPVVPPGPCAPHEMGSAADATETE